MPRSGGVATLIPSYYATPGQTIRTEQHNPVLEDIASMLTGSLARDGSSPMLAGLPMNGFRVTNLGAGVNPTDAAQLGQTASGVMTTRGDMLRRGAAAAERIPLGTLGQIMKAGAADPAWATVTGADIAWDTVGNLTRSLVWVAQGASFTFVATDRGKRHRLSSGGVTATLLPVATAGSGWTIEVEDIIGSNVIASPATDISVNGSAGVASYAFSKGEWGVLASNGSAYTLSTNKPAASTTSAGAVRLALASEVDTGTDASKAVTAAALAGSKRTVKAWWDLTAAGVMNAGFGISSTTKNSTGNYTVNLSATAPGYYGMGLESDVLITSRVSKSTTSVTYRTGFGSSYNPQDANSSGMIIY